MSRELLGVGTVTVRSAASETTTSAGAADRATADAGATVPGGVETRASSWADNVKNAIPIEVVTAWAAIVPLLATGNPPRQELAYWVLFGVFCLATAAHMWVDVETPTEAMADRMGVPFAYLKQSQYAQILLAVGGFVVWAYYLGDPTTGSPGGGAGIQRAGEAAYANVLLALYVVLGPQLVPNVLRKLHGLDVPGERKPTDWSETERESATAEPGESDDAEPNQSDSDPGN